MAAEAGPTTRGGRDGAVRGCHCWADRDPKVRRSVRFFEVGCCAGSGTAGKARENDKRDSQRNMVCLLTAKPMSVLLLGGDRSIDPQRPKLAEEEGGRGRESGHRLKERVTRHVLSGRAPEGGGAPQTRNRIIRTLRAEGHQRPCARSSRPPFLHEGERRAAARGRTSRAGVAWSRPPSFHHFHETLAREKRERQL